MNFLSKFNSQIFQYLKDIHRLYLKSNPCDFSIMMSSLKEGATPAIPKFSKIENLFLIDCNKNHSLSFAKKIPKLKSINIHGECPEIDFLDFPNLRDLGATWRKNLFKNTTHSTLESLRLDKYNEEDVTNLIELTNLRELIIVRSTLKSLIGINNFSKIESIRLSNLIKLTDISSLSGCKAISIYIENAKQISSYLPLAECKNLTHLCIHGSAPIPSLDFINALPNLLSFRFINTEIMDGNLHPLLRLGDVDFIQKSKYSHRLRDFKQNYAK